MTNHKPIISDEVLSARKTGGGSPEAELTELEAKLKSIKGKLFEGVQGGIDICSASPITPLSDSDMSIVEEMKPPRKRKFFDERSNLTDTHLKKALLETEQEKIGLVRNIYNKMVNLLGQIVGIQNRLLSNTTSQLHPSYLLHPTTLLPPFAPQPYPSTFMQQHFPSND